MGSVSVSHLIIFIASIVVAAGVAGTLAGGVTSVSSAIDDGTVDVTQEIRTDITVLNDPSITFQTTDSTSIDVYVRNTGSTDLHPRPANIDIIYNGRFISNEEFTVTEVESDASSWKPGDVVEITLTDVEVQDGRNNVYIIVNGNEEEYTFIGEN